MLGQILGIGIPVKDLYHFISSQVYENVHHCEGSR